MFCRDLPGLMMQAPGTVLRAWRERPSIVIVRGRKALGDRLMVTPLLRALRQHVPVLHVTVAARYRDVYRANPHIDQLRAWHLWESLRTISPNHGKGTHIVRGMWEDIWGHLVRRGLSEGECPEIDVRPELFLTDAEREWGRAAIARPAGTRPVIAIIGGGRTNPTWNREWGFENFCALAAALVPHAELVQIAGEPVTYAPGKTVRFIPADVRQAASVLAACDAFVTQEGGLMHLAAAVGTPTVAIFGGTILPRSTGYDGNRNLANQLECSPCLHLQRNCPHLKCMESITVRRVAEELASLLAERGLALPAEAVAAGPDTWTPPAFLSDPELAARVAVPPRQRSRRHRKD